MLNVHGGLVVEGMEVEGEKGEMKAWMCAGKAFMEKKAFEGVVGLLNEAKRVVKRESYHVKLS